MDARRRKQPVKASKEDDYSSSSSRKSSNNGLSNCKGLLLLALLLALGVCIFVWAYPSPVNPVSFRYANCSAPDLLGPLAVNDLLKHGERLFENEIVGPEALVTDKEGNIYTGLADGRIIKISKDLTSYSVVLRTGKDLDVCGQDSTIIEDLCGRPLGMQFSRKNDRELLVVDSSQGLLKVNIDTRTMETLLSKNTSPIPINLLNDLVELPNGTLLITDSSLKFSRHDNRNEVLECRCNGQLLAFEPSDGSVRVVLKDLFFPNGLCLSADGESVLFAETTRARIKRYYFSGSKAGSMEIFSENLPSWPDNVSPSLSGGYWVGNAIIRSPILNFFATYFVSFRSILAKFHLMPLLEKILPAHGLVLELDKEGRVIRSLHDKGGHLTHSTSHILERRNGELLIGSYNMPFLVRLQL